MTPILACRGCGRTKTEPTGDPADFFPSEHCGDCPPWRCEDCGQMCSAAQKCPCWTDITTMAHADIKALLATDGMFSLSPPAGGAA